MCLFGKTTFLNDPPFCFAVEGYESNNFRGSKTPAFIICEHRDRFKEQTDDKTTCTS